MTEQEQKAIKWMQNVRDDAVVTLGHIAKEEPNVSPMLYAGRKEKAETIINGFEELEQYREIGTLEECRAAVEKQKEIKSTNTCGFMTIGKTVEQFEQEIRYKAIDDFSHEIKETFNLEIPLNYPSTKPFFTLENARKLVEDVAEQLKDGSGE